MSRIFDIADRYVESCAKLDPLGATMRGIDGYDSQVNDFSVDGYLRRHDLNCRTKERLNATAPETDRDRIAADVLNERLERSIDWHESAEYLREISMKYSPPQDIRDVFDEMPRDTNEQWRRIVERMYEVPTGIDSYISTLRVGLERKFVSSQRIALAVARQAAFWSGMAEGSSRFFAGLVEACESRDNVDRRISDGLRRAAVGADGAYAQLATFLEKEYAPNAAEADGVGRERYEQAAAEHLGESINVNETYAWAWDEMHRIDSEIRVVCEQIAPGKSLKEVIEILDDDYERWLHGEDALVDWLRGLLDHTLKKLDGEHFDIPEQMRRIDVRIPPPGGAEIPYYSAPSEDWSRPGTFWRPNNAGRTRFPMWSEISLAYHEGVPGHHLQFGYVRFMGDKLSRFQRLLYIAGHGEGWALYAERLMDELGYLDRPEYRLDMLLKSLFRAARVVIDIGMHLGLRIPSTEQFCPGEVWTPDLASRMLHSCTNLNSSLIASEIDRYLGYPGQAITYKVGERGWVAAREARKQREGSAFDLKSFHREALSLGPMGMAQLKRELAQAL